MVAESRSSFRISFNENFVGNPKFTSMFIHALLQECFYTHYHKYDFEPSLILNLRLMNFTEKCIFWDKILLFKMFLNYSTGKPRYTTGTPRYTTGTPRYTTGTPRYTTGKPRYTKGTRQVHHGTR